MLTSLSIGAARRKRGDKDKDEDEAEEATLEDRKVSLRDDAPDDTRRQ